MNNWICQKCNTQNTMGFCMNCGASANAQSASDLPPTVIGMMPPFVPPPHQPAQMPPNFQQPPQQQSFQPSQQPNFQPLQAAHFQSAPQTSGGQTKKILLGIGGVLVGLIVLASGGVKLYRAFGGSSSSPTTVSMTPQNTTNSSSSNTTSPTNSTEELLPETVGDFKQKYRQKQMDDYTVKDYGAIETYYVSYDDGVRAFVSKFKDSADADKTLNIFKGKATSTTGDYVSWAVMKNEEVKDGTGQVIGKMVLLIDFGDGAAKEKKEKGTPEPEYILATHNNYLYRIYTSKRAGDAQAFYNKLPFK